MDKTAVKSIPKLAAKGMTAGAIAEYYDVHENTVRYWVKRLREDGVKVKWSRIGRKKLLIK